MVAEIFCLMTRWLNLCVVLRNCTEIRTYTGTRGHKVTEIELRSSWSRTYWLPCNCTQALVRSDAPRPPPHYQTHREGTLCMNRIWHRKMTVSGQLMSQMSSGAKTKKASQLRKRGAVSPVVKNRYESPITTRNSSRRNFLKLWAIKFIDLKQKLIAC